MRSFLCTFLLLFFCLSGINAEQRNNNDRIDIIRASIEKLDTWTLIHNEFTESLPKDALTLSNKDEIPSSEWAKCVKINRLTVSGRKAIMTVDNCSEPYPTFYLTMIFKKRRGEWRFSNFKEMVLLK
jgi:hypothetical protein